MKLKFKKQAYQTNAVEAVADCFAGQPKREGLNYRVDPGRAVDASGQLFWGDEPVSPQQLQAKVVDADQRQRYAVPPPPHRLRRCPSPTSRSSTTCAAFRVRCWSAWARADRC